MEYTVSVIGNIANFIEKERMINEPVFHKAKLLLTLYRDVMWRTDENIADIEFEKAELGYQRTSELADFLQYEFDNSFNRTKMVDRLMSIAETKFITELVESTLLKIKTYPKYGELYYDILSNKFMNTFKYTDEDLIEVLQIGQTQYYKRKKEAINIFGIALWGYVLPPLRKLWSDVATTEAEYAK